MVSSFIIIFTTVIFQTIHNIQQQVLQRVSWFAEPDKLQHVAPHQPWTENLFLSKLLLFSYIVFEVLFFMVFVACEWKNKRVTLMCLRLCAAVSHTNYCLWFEKENLLNSTRKKKLKEKVERWSEGCIHPKIQSTMLRVSCRFLLIDFKTSIHNVNEKFTWLGH